MKQITRSLLITTLVTTALLTGCGGSGSSQSVPQPQPQPQPVPAPLPETLDLQALVDARVSEDVPGIVLLVGKNGDTETVVAGVSSRTSLLPLQPDDIMPAGSAGKSMIAVLALQLQEEGQLDLDDTLDTWLSATILDHIPNARQMTLRQLLNHTSGVYDFLHNPAFAQDVAADPERLRLDSQALLYALGQPAHFTPGERHQYSNTGYLLAGLILDKVLGEHHSVALRERILTPLGMDQTFYIAAESADQVLNNRDFISGYRSLNDLGLSDDTSLTDLKPLVAQLGVASGPVAASVSDFALYQQGLAEEGVLLYEQSRQELIGDEYVVSVDEPGLLEGSEVVYGLGLYRETTEDTTLYHHGGDHYGWLTQNIIWQEEQLQLVLMVNCGGERCQTASSEIVQSVLQHYRQ